MRDFDTDKKNVLEKKDKSRKQTVDKGIAKIVAKLNSKNDFYTTSSCYGRIVLLAVPQSGKKNESEWLFVKHGKTSFTELKKALAKPPKKKVWLKQEGAILHVCCRNLESAQKLIRAAKDAGMKRSGMISVNSRFIVEIIGTETLCTIVAKDGRQIISDDYLNVLVGECNKKMTSNAQKLALFDKLIGPI